MAQASRSKSSKQSSKSEPVAAAAQQTPHAPFQAASDRYFGDINVVWSDAQRSVQELQLDFLRAQVRLGHKQPLMDPQALQSEYQALQADFQGQFEKLASDPEPAERLAGAYATYRDAVRKSLADADKDTLDPVTLGVIAQQVLGVSQVAEQIRQWLVRPESAKN